MGCLIKSIIIFIVFIGLLSLMNPYGRLENEKGNSESNQQQKKISYCPDMELKAKISFDGSQFIITNEDSFDWNNVKMEVNSKYKYQSKYLLEAGKTYTIGAMQFADNGGNRFNPFAQKAQEFYVKAYAPDDTGCFWRGDF